MKNIIDNPEIIAFRGQLYDGPRDQYLGHDNFVAGDGDYFTTSFADASRYAVVEPMHNIDLPSNISHIANLTFRDYNEVKSEIIENGDGLVYTAKITPSRLISFGANDEFMDIQDVDRFKMVFDYALKMTCPEMPKSAVDKFTISILANNHQPQKVLEEFQRRGAMKALREIAIGYNCDCFELKGEMSIAKKSVSDKNVPSHICVLDPKAIKNVLERAPVVPNKVVYMPVVESDDIDNIEVALDEFKSAMREVKCELIDALGIEEGGVHAGVKVKSKGPDPIKM